MGGEKGLRFPAFFTREGSPPRGRGKVTHGEEVLKGERITPAWAGKSSFCHVCQVFDQDHPRVGGEKLRVALWRLDTRGSPPRGRGKGFSCGCCPGIEGITPAWAGKRYLRGSLPLACADHPRVGGEKSTISGWSTKYWGSPPRGRGKGNFSPPFDNPKRITPAWAGKSAYCWALGARD